MLTPRNVGHGHVFPRPDGLKARCGGPGFCPTCNADRALKDRLHPLSGTGIPFPRDEHGNLKWMKEEPVPADPKKDSRIARPLADYHEDMGSVLWWKFPIEEPPYVGSPLDVRWQQNNWDAYYTHFTVLTIPTTSTDGAQVVR